MKTNYHAILNYELYILNESGGNHSKYRIYHTAYKRFWLVIKISFCIIARMLSLYIHVPFCDKKCGYCSFFVIPKEWVDPQQKMIEGYLTGVMRDIEHRGTLYEKPALKTLYFGWGTPGILGKETLMKIIDHVSEYFDVSYLEELSIELNPNPYDEMLDLIQTITNTYKDLPRVRFSLGIQSFDDRILSASSRQYSFDGIQKFLRSLREIKDARNVFNLDFISFGSGERTRDDEYLFWDRARRERFETLATSGFVDSFSLYTLELFAGSQWEKSKRKEIDGQSHLDLSHVPFETDQEKITTEFQWLKESILDAWYRRYELSNFALPGRESIHNMTYRDMWSYIGIGPSASSFLAGEYARQIPEAHDSLGIRFTESTSIFGYSKESSRDKESTIVLTHKEYLTEKVFLALRTATGVKEFSSYAEVLVPHRNSLITEYEKNGFVSYQGDTLKLTDEWLDVYNTLVSDLLALE